MRDMVSCRENLLVRTNKDYKSLNRTSLSRKEDVCDVKEWLIHWEVVFEDMNLKEMERGRLQYTSSRRMLCIGGMIKGK